jgi:hypothetical protein
VVDRNDRLHRPIERAHRKLAGPGAVARARIHAKEDAEKGPPLVGTTTITQEGIGTLRLANRRSPTQLNGDF